MSFAEAKPLPPQITNPDELKVNDEDNLAENEAKVSMDVEHTSEVGLAM